MLVIAVVVNSHRIGRYIDQASAPPPRPPVVQAQPAPVAPIAPVQPQYPIKKTIEINQNGWSEVVAINNGEQLEWKLLNNDAWLDVRGNGTDERRQFPPSDSRWKPIPIGDSARTLEFRITPGTPVQTALVAITIRQGVDRNFFDNGKSLPSATPSLTDSGAKAGPQWPSELKPTRYESLPPINYVPGNIVSDTIYPIEDLLYIIPPGWTATPFSDNGNQSLQIAADVVGFRIRVSNPDNPVVVKFKIVETKTQNATVSTPNWPEPRSQNVTIWNPSPPPQGSRQAPMMRPVVPPNQPSYYPTAPTGPSYYPASPAQPARKK